MPGCRHVRATLSAASALCAAWAPAAGAPPAGSPPRGRLSVPGAPCALIAPAWLRRRGGSTEIALKQTTLSPNGY